MKQNKTEWPAYMFLTLLGIIISGIIIYYVKNSMDITTSIADEIINNQEEIANDYANYEYTKYDGEEVRGDQVVNFIKKELGNYSASEAAAIYVEVVTIISGITRTNRYKNKQYIRDIKNFSKTQYYIKPTAYFTGEIVKTANNAILGVRFVQK